ncbi:beta-glucosidase 13-like, partial [Prunus dulcis]
FMDPLTRGDYPQSMRSIVKERLPNFTEEQSKSLIGSYDYIGVNYYSSRYASAYPEGYSITTPPSYLTDAYVNVTTELNGVPIGPQAASDWLYVYPKGLYDLVLYTKKNYNDPIIYITENGMDEFNNPKVSLERALDDSNRIDYYYRHLCYLQEAIIEGANVQGYFAWSLLDNFEWSEGYTVRFGINYVDYDNGLKRHSKLSMHWFKSFLKRSSISKEKIRRCGNNNARAHKFVYQI